MGLNIKELVQAKEVTFEELKNKKLAVDSFNLLYQFLTTIRQPDGTPLKDSTGRITSHMNGLFNRTASLMQKGIKLVFVFDGKAPEIKTKERQRRAELKKDARKEYEIAKQRQDIESMKKYASRDVRLEPGMIEEAKELISALGLPVVQAPCEGEAQAAHMAKKGDCFATVSQDFDTVIYASPKLVRNLSISSRKKKTGKLGFDTVKPEIVTYSDVLNSTGLDSDQLVILAILIGTDYNYGGIKGIGPVKAMKLIKRHGSNFDAIFEEAEWNKYFDMPWTDIFYTFKKMPVSDDYKLEWQNPDFDKIRKMLIEEREFSRERVENVIERLQNSMIEKKQKGLGDFF